MRRWFKVLLALLIFGLLFWLIEWRDVLTAFSHLSWASVGALLLVAVLLIYVSALKWQLFLEHAGAKISALKLFNLYLLGYFVNLLMPSYVGGDVARSYYVGKQAGQAEALGATVLERYTGLVAMLLLGLLFSPWVDLVTWQIEVALILISVAVGFLTVIALSERGLQIITCMPYLGWASQGLKKMQNAFRLAKADHALLFKTFALSLVYHSLTVVNTLVAAWAIGWHNPPLGELFVVLPLILLIGALPLTPQGLGLQEGAFSYFLSGIGATPAEALSLALVLRAKSYILAIFGGLVWLKYQSHPKLTETRSEVSDS